MLGTGPWILMNSVSKLYCNLLLLWKLKQREESKHLKQSAWGDNYTQDQWLCEEPGQQTCGAPETTTGDSHTTEGDMVQSRHAYNITASQKPPCKEQ